MTPTAAGFLAFFGWILALAVMWFVSAAIFYGAWNYSIPKIVASTGSTATTSNLDWWSAFIALAMFWAMLSPVIFAVHVAGSGNMISNWMGRKREAAPYHESWRPKATSI